MFKADYASSLFFKQAPAFVRFRTKQMAENRQSTKRSVAEGGLLYIWLHHLPNDFVLVGIYIYKRPVSLFYV
jgi:hypothetical protein